MKRFGLREANQNFARLVRTLRNGEDVLLLDRGKPLAVVKPVASSDEALERLTARGLLLPATRPGPLPRFRPIRVRGGLSKAVIADRNERG
jgi:prevent-host-death family protein